MRHTHSGLAIPDFPKMGGFWLPPFNQAMMQNINAMHFIYNLETVTMGQVVIHFIHRLWAGLILAATALLTLITFRRQGKHTSVCSSVLILDLLIIVQIILGITTVSSQKSPLITSLHVMTGAATLGWVTLLLLRASPLSFRQFKEIVL